MTNFKKVIASMLAMSMLVGFVPQTFAMQNFGVDTITSATPETEYGNSDDTVVFEFGSEATELEAGTYAVPVSLKQAYKPEEDSMANDSLVKTAILKVYEDGTAAIQTEYQPLEFSGITGEVIDVKYYTSDSIDANYLVDAFFTVMNENDTVKYATISVENKTSDSIFVNVGDTFHPEGMDILLVMEYAQAIPTDESNFLADVKVEEDKTSTPFVFGSSETTFEEGDHEITVSVRNATNLENLSSASGGIEEVATLTVDENGAGFITIDLVETAEYSRTMGDTVITMEYFLENVKYYTGVDTTTEDAIDATIVESYENGQAKSVSFPVTINEENGVYVSAVMNTGGSYNASHDLFLLVDEFENGIPKTSTPFVFGSSQTTFEEGDHEITVSVRNATNLENLSSASGGIEEVATLTVDENGAGFITIDLVETAEYSRTMGDTVITMEYFLENVKYYAGELTASEYAIDADVVAYFAESEQVKTVSMPITANYENGIYVNAIMNTGGTYNAGHDLFLLVDEFENGIPKTSTPFVFGSSETTFEEGDHEITVSVRNATNLENLSSASGGIEEVATLTVDENGAGFITIDLVETAEYSRTMGDTVIEMEYFIENVKYYAGELTASEYAIDADVVAYFAESEQVKTVSMPITANCEDGIYVNAIMNTGGSYNAGHDLFLLVDEFENGVVAEENEDNAGGNSGGTTTTVDITKNGKYAVQVSLGHAYTDATSMGDPAFANNRTAYVTTTNGSYYIEVGTNPITLASIYGGITEIFSTDGLMSNLKTTVTYDDKLIAGEYISKFTFTTTELPDYFMIAINVDGTPMTNNTEAKLILDWSSAKSTSSSLTPNTGSVAGTDTTVDTDEETDEETDDNLTQENITVENFSDINTNDWFFEAVQTVIAEGLMTGVTADSFAPQQTMSRAMIWTVLYRYAGGEGETTGANWYDAAQAWSIETGVSDGTNPDGDMTREQLATLLFRLENLLASETTEETTEVEATEENADLTVFTDATEISSWAEEAMNWAISNGIMQGFDGKLNPTATATRAEVATMLARYIA